MSREKLKAYFKLYRTMLKGYEKKVAFLFSLTFFNGVLGSIGIATLAPLFSLVLGDDTAIANNVFSKWIDAVFVAFGIDFGLRALLVFVVLVFAVKAFILYIFTYLSGSINIGINNDIKKKIYTDTFSANWSYLSKEKIGYLENSMTVDVTHVTELLEALYKASLYFFSFILYLATAFYLSFFVTGTALILGLLVLFLSQFVVRIVRKYADEQRSIKRSINNFINESVIGSKTVKITNSEKSMALALGKLFEEFKKTALKIIRIGALLQSPTETLSYIFMAGVFALSYSRPGFNLAEFLVTLYLLKEIFVYTDRFQSTMYRFAAAQPYLDKMSKLIRALEKSAERDSGTKEFYFGDSLSFEDVGFAYGKKRARVLDGTSFKIKKGETVGIVGPSGAGKTTILDLMLRLFEPASGRISVDGFAASDFKLSSWRRRVGYVSQDVFLRNDVIENNIKFFDDAITADAVSKAAAMANVSEFTERLPMGLSAPVGERGTLFSVGQRQRIALARILARNPEILLLDEVTSALDAHSEQLIKQAVNHLKNSGITVIIVAHRLTTVLDADRILYLEEGKIVEEGNPQKLLADPESRLFKMYNAAV